MAAVPRRMCIQSALSVHLASLRHPKNLNVRDVDRRTDISHMKSGRSSALHSRQADTEIKSTGSLIKSHVQWPAYQVTEGLLGTARTSEELAFTSGEDAKETDQVLLFHSVPATYFI